MSVKQANQLLGKNKLKEAELHFKTVLKSNPDNGEAWFGLGQIALRLERNDAAVYLLQKACERLPNRLEPLHALATAFNNVNSPADALTVLKYATSLARNNPIAYYYLAQHYLTYGELDKAHTCLSHALSLEVSAVTAYVLFELVELGRFSKAHNYISDLQQLLAKTTNVQHKMVCYYALAKSYDKLGDTEKAFNYFVLANKLQRTLSDFHTEQLTDFYAEIIKTNTTAFINSAELTPQATITPVFIIGMPRSGSTLVEQMLANHSQCATLGENPGISRDVVAFLEHQTGLQYPQCLTRLNATLINQAREIYLATLNAVTPKQPVVINKLPSNYQSIGLIHVLFPNAKFINLTRNFHATAFSVFSNYFAENEPYFCSLPEFKHYHALYEQLMCHWQSMPALNIYNLSYEALIANPQQQLSSLLAFLNCRYENTCLDFYQQKNAVTTLSKQAIRKPVNNNSIDKWQRYKQPLLTFLGEMKTNSVDL